MLLLLLIVVVGCVIVVGVVVVVVVVAIFVHPLRAMPLHVVIANARPHDDHSSHMKYILVSHPFPQFSSKAPTYHLAETLHDVVELCLVAQRGG